MRVPPIDASIRVEKVALGRRNPSRPHARGPLAIGMAFAGQGVLVFASGGCSPLVFDLFPDAASPEPIVESTDGGLRSDVTDAFIDDSNWSDAAIAPETEGGGSAGCATNADCMESSASICDPILRACVQCSGDAGCSEHKKACNQTTHSCELPCAMDSDCDSPGVCDTNQGVCADCLTDTRGSCGGTSEPYCVSEVCVECRTSADCKSQEFCWATAGNCVACLYDTDCPSGEMCSSRHECK